MLKIIFQNFLSFDFIIFIMALVNTVILVQTIRFSKKLYDSLNPYCWIPGGEASLREIQGKFARHSRVDSEADIIRLRRSMNAFYVVYENLTAIFPLLGLLGTVVSLIPLVNSMGEVPTGLFFSALTSTMWGIIFAIVFKLANGYVASGIEDNEKNIDIYLQRNTDKITRARMLAESSAQSQETVADAAENVQTGSGSVAENAAPVQETVQTGAGSAAEGAATTVETVVETTETTENAEATAAEEAATVETVVPMQEAAETDGVSSEADPYEYVPHRRPDPSELAPEFFNNDVNEKEGADEKA